MKEKIKVFGKFEVYIATLFAVLFLLFLGAASVSAAEGPAVMIVDNGVDFYRNGIWRICSVF
jgi:hypothetical protein